jgi:small subunit ribosomal protein S6
LIATVEHAATEKGAKIEKTEKWGRKRMAYRVHRLREGFYVYMVLKSSHSEVVKELERRLKVSDPVIKYLTVRLDEELKRQEKFKRHREKRAARRPRKTAPAPGAPVGGEQQAATL